MTIESVFCVLAGWFFVFVGLKFRKEWGMVAGAILALGILFIAIGASISTIA